tara:strand:+ start:1571 stop:1924 length:354 start_codon:yes stop_codon:yes gene_type:complete
MSVLNKKSLLDLVPGNTPQTSNPNTQQLNPPPRDEMVGHYDKMKPTFWHNGPESPTPGERDTLHERNLEDIYTSQTNPDPKFGYGAGQPGSTWPSFKPSEFDLKGNTPKQYIDNIPE